MATTKIKIGSIIKLNVNKITLNIAIKDGVSVGDRTLEEIKYDEELLKKAIIAGESKTLWGGCYKQIKFKITGVGSLNLKPSYAIEIV